MSEGRYLDALRETRQSVDDGNPVTYDPLVYVLGAVGRLEEAMALRAKRFELERAGAPRSWQMRRIIKLAKQGNIVRRQARRVQPRELAPEDAVPEIIGAIQSQRVVILGEDIMPRSPRFWRAPPCRVL